MTCPKCTTALPWIDPEPRDRTVRRVVRCRQCGHTWSADVLEVEIAFVVDRLAALAEPEGVHR